MNFSVSVIIPAFNVAHYIEKAVISANRQAEVSEIIVVNDGSTDATLAILEQLQIDIPIMKIVHHINELNKGRSASRNLGIQNASENFIAFLDADDFYLENRFKNDELLFLKKPEIDGVYNAIGAHFYREATISEQEKLKLTTVTEKIKPEELFEALLSGKKGYFSIDGLTIKKSVFEGVGYFTESLMVSEDTEFFFKISLKCQLLAGIIEQPVAMRGIHENNVCNREDLYEVFRIKMYESLFFWSYKEQLSIKIINKFLELVWLLKYKEKNSFYNDLMYWVYLFLPNPKMLFSKLSIKYFPVKLLRKKFFPILFLH